LATLGIVTTEAKEMGESAKNNASVFRGRERRKHKVLLTRNTEYHFREMLCVAVRDRRTGEWLPGHLALRRQLFGSIRFFMNGALVPNPGEPKVGEALFFGEGGRDLITSPLERVERPQREVVAEYPS
jgi:hypothetical protein